MITIRRKIVKIATALCVISSSLSILICSMICFLAISQTLISGIVIIPILFLVFISVIVSILSSIICFYNVKNIKKDNLSFLYSYINSANYICIFFSSISMLSILFSLILYINYF